MNNSPNWHEYQNAEQLAESLAQNVAQKLSEKIKPSANAQLFVSGGQSPVRFFQQLSDIPINWDKIDIGLVDERCIPLTHADSNSSLVKKHLLQNAAASAHWHPLVDVNGAPSLQPLNPSEGAICILGMGEDSHTASLFPDAANILTGLDLTRPKGYLSVNPTKAPHARYSLNASALVNMSHLILLIQGEKKRQILGQAQNKADVEHPIGFILLHALGSIDIYWSP